MNTDTIITKAFRELTLDELYQILHARQEVFALEQNIMYQDMDFIDQKSVHLFIRDEENGQIKAYLRIIAPGVKYPEVSIGRVLTMPHYRHQGYARRLMLEAMATARRLFPESIKIEAQEYLVKFYETIGFTPISEPFILEGISHVEMILDN